MRLVLPNLHSQLIIWPWDMRDYRFFKAEALPLICGSKIVKVIYVVQALEGAFLGLNLD